MAIQFIGCAALVLISWFFHSQCTGYVSVSGIICNVCHLLYLCLSSLLSNCIGFFVLQIFDEISDFSEKIGGLLCE